MRVFKGLLTSNWALGFPKYTTGFQSHALVFIIFSGSATLEHLKVADVTFEDVDRLHQRITKAGHPYRANRVIAVLSKMFALAIRWNMRDDNPCVGIERNVEHSRRRYLKDDELARLVRALATHADKQAADVVRLLLLTGCRRGEALAARWADLDLVKGVWSKPASSVKQNTPHEAPLSAPARQLLSRRFATRTLPSIRSARWVNTSFPAMVPRGTGSISSVIGGSSPKPPVSPA